jgi:hypothetical protein
MSGACSTHGKNEKYIQLLFEKPKERVHLEELGVDGKIIFKYILRKWSGIVCTGFMCFSIGTNCRPLSTCHKPSGSIKGGDFIDYISNCQLSKDFPPWS